MTVWVVLVGRGALGKIFEAVLSWDAPNMSKLLNNGLVNELIPADVIKRGSGSLQLRASITQPERR